MRRPGNRFLPPPWRGAARPRHSEAAVLPQWIRPQLTQLVDMAPEGGQWLHEIKSAG